MCMSDPGRVLEMDAGGEGAIVELRGRPRSISIALLTLEGTALDVGDWVLVSAGMAVERLEEAEASELMEFIEAARGEGA